MDKDEVNNASVQQSWFYFVHVYIKKNTQNMAISESISRHVTAHKIET